MGRFGQNTMITADNMMLAMSEVPQFLQVMLAAVALIVVSRFFKS